MKFRDPFVSGGIFERWGRDSECGNSISSVEARFRVLGRDFERWGRDSECGNAISNVEARFRALKRDFECWAPLRSQLLFKG